MSRTSPKNPASPVPGRSPARPSSAPARADAGKSEGYRETVEAIVVAVILALVVRGFEAQAFVIPTGSMAPTLMGRHKEVTCPQCGFVYSVNASEEVEGGPRARRVYSGICVNCRYQATRLDAEPSYKGDRILVSMFPYDLPFMSGLTTMERWNVIVFRYPEEPEVSYIKRLVGLPGETIKIHHGDIYVKKGDEDEFRLARKSPRHQAAMQVTVYDDRHQPRATAGREAWRRWASERPGGWKLLDPGLSRYQCDEPTEGWVDLRYRNLVPDPEQWDDLINGRTPRRDPRATLITDFYSYNTGLSAEGSNLLEGLRADAEGAWLQPHWVGDLTLSANVEVSSPGGELRFELVKGGVAHQCLIDLATGEARFVRGGETLAELQTAMTKPGRYGLEFANVDDRLLLSVNGSVIGSGVEYESGEAPPLPTAADLSPAAISARGASISASDLVLKRDIYYTQTPGRNDYGPVWEEFYPRTPVELFDFLADPSRFSDLTRTRQIEYELGDDRYLMMGDNSPRSKDSRGWGSADWSWDTVDRQTWEVPLDLVTGKAFFVYWPHGVPFGPDIRIGPDLRVPFRPYLERMRWIR